MIKATTRLNDGRPLLILGLSGENITRLVAGEPVWIDVGAIGGGMPQMQIAMLYGRTEDDIKRDLAPLIGPDTEQRYE